MKLYTAIFSFLLVASFISCEKTEGPGGTSTIVGKIWVQGYDRDRNIDTPGFAYWAEEEDVYLIYGNDTIYSDRTRTNFDGSFWFQYLHEGTYTIYVYSDTAYAASRSGRIIKSHTVNIGSDGSTIEIPTITIRDNN